jgi:hypothetical protein
MKSCFAAFPAPVTDAASTLLHQAYADLGLEDGRLLGSATSPARVDDPAVWRDVGEWLMLADRLGADRVFFVGDDPVLIFAHLGARADEADITALYRRAWSMARPRCLFVDLGDELRVYRLDAPPPHPTSGDPVITPIEVVSRATNIQDALAPFHRDRFESGVAFEDEKATSAGRADRRLLRDVAIATAALEEQGLSSRAAHELIERAILVRYLEDRGVLTEAYFDEVEAGNAASTPTADEASVTFGPRSRFIDLLADIELTRALFARLAADFNGDLFVTGDDAASVTQRHLDLLKNLLTGAAGDTQEPLFLWAYDFSVVPTSLVSTMYELFYNQEVEGSTSSTYYTPAELVEFVVADVLSPELLDRHPTVCDPACGSGIFLVEAFRRIARHASAAAGRRLTSAQLRRLLLERVAGCDIDESAVRLAAFSLYVAFLNYQTPQDIRAAGPLPRLITSASEDGPSGNRPLVVGNAFSALDDETAVPSNAYATKLPWSTGAFDVVIGNPPWTEPSRTRRTLADDWIKARRLPLGDRSPSQQFLWRTLDLLAPDGVAALLVSAKVLFNTRTTSRRFRSAWLGRVQIQRALNFSEVRHHFFERAVAPFVLLRFAHRAQDDSPAAFVYETARPVPTGRRGSAHLARLDRQRVDQATLMAKDFLWKTYSAGDHRDHALVERLGLFPRLGDMPSDSPKAQYGYQNASPTDRNGHPTPKSWANIEGLKTFESWGPLRESWLEDVRSRVKFDPAAELFLRRTLVVRRGVSPGFGPHARLLDRPMAFRHHIYGIPLGHRAEWEAYAALGFLLSSVGRYWLFMVSGAWGTWKDEVRSEQLLLLPVRLDEGHPATSRLVRAARLLPDAQPGGALSLNQDHTPTSLSDVLSEINESAYELFDLSEAERDLIEDFWRDQRKASVSALAVGTTEDQDIFDRYADVFRSVWKPLLADAAGLDAHFYGDAGARVIAAAFETRDPQETVGTSTSGDADWSDVLERYAVALDRRADHRLLERGELRAVTDTAIIVVKRTERHFWSASAARRDAEATAAQLIASQGRPE